MAYASLPALKEMLGVVDSDLDADAQRALDAASAAVDELTNRRRGGFERDAAPSTRRYTAASRTLVVVDDIAEVDEVLSDGTQVEVVAEPLNAPADGEPYTRLVSVAGLLSGVPGAIEVTGTYGWPAAPPQVPQFVLIAATKLVKRAREAPFGLVTGSYDSEVVRLSREDPDLQFLLAPLRRHTPVVA